MSFLADIIKTIILGIIQGLTEWLPISSTGHLILFQSVCPLSPQEFFDVFKVIIQLGSVLAVIFVYFKSLNPFDQKKSKTLKKRTYHLWILILVSILPAIPVGILFNDIIDQYLSAPFIIAVVLIAYGIIYLIIERNPKKAKMHSMTQLDLRSALKIGLYQCLAFIPGTSRLGATILGGMHCGCNRLVACEYSMLISVPTMFGAGVYKLHHYIVEYGFFSFYELVLLILGVIVSFVVGMVTIRALLNYVKQHDLKLFGYYRIILGVFVLLFFYIL